MNDDTLEERLAALRPAHLPQELSARLASPPAAASGEATPFLRRRSVRWSVAAAALATAAAVVAMSGLFTPRPPSPGPSAVSGTSTRVLSVTPVTRVGHGEHLYDLVEVEWERETTFVSPVTAQAVVVQDRHRSLVPVSLHFD